MTEDGSAQVVQPMSAQVTEFEIKTEVTEPEIKMEIDEQSNII
jgi:hypothetical protein